MQTCRNPAGQLWMLCADFFRWLFLSICGVWRGSPLLLGLHKLSELAEHIASWIMAYVPYILVIGAMTWELVGFSFSPHPSHVFHCPVAILRHFHTALAKHKHTKCWDIPLTPFLPTIHTTDSRSMFFFFTMTSFRVRWRSVLVAGVLAKMSLSHYSNDWPVSNQFETLPTWYSICNPWWGQKPIYL